LPLTVRGIGQWPPASSALVQRKDGSFPGGFPGSSAEPSTSEQPALSPCYIVPAVKRPCASGGGCPALISQLGVGDSYACRQSLLTCTECLIVQMLFTATRSAGVLARII
jgi:hypothetical protein